MSCLPLDRVLVVAELSGNHNGSLDRALALLTAAKEAGADLVKLQTYTADTITLDAPGPWFQITEGPWAGRRLYDLYQEASTPWEWHGPLFAAAHKLGLPCFSTPFDPTAVTFLEQFNPPFHKIASFEIVDLPLVACVAKTGRPVIMSTGMANLSEIDMAVRTLRQGGCPEVVLLNCVSAYPAPPESMHLGNIPRLAQTFACHAGLSDHTLDDTAAIAAVALGARVIEKHLCLRRADGGPDAGFSLEPEEFAAMVRRIRQASAAVLASPQFGPGQADVGNVIFRKSLFVVRDVAAGAILTADDVRPIRPGHGLPPMYLSAVLGRRARGPIPRGTPLAWDLLA